LIAIRAPVTDITSWVMAASSDSVRKPWAIVVP
jgi:hypothetical protein